MKKIVKIQAILLFLLGLTLQAPAQSVNLTPWPKTMTTKSGEFVLPQTITIDVSELSDDVVAEANDFAATLRAATGRSVTVGNAENAAIKLQMNASTLDEEGYILVVAEDGITLKASTVKGFFYGLQSIKKMLPGNVLVEKLDASATYAIPCVTINDAPRFAYRGFMLDVSRHFFTVEEIKKMLRIMAYYKMNFFHWHLTDDQGWRVEVKKYPKLTTVAATRANSYNTDLKYGQYWTNEQYGPYFYTQDEIRDVVAYAEKLHITVIPEIEMPGHLAAAMTAYPEFSCTPNGSHNVWVSGGISQDVLNVANDRAVQFAKDILTEIAPLFPSEIFHVGGDECPTNAWQNNAQCQALYQKEGMTNYSQLQSRFTKQIAAHLQTLGKRIAVWNEAITAGGADTKLIQDSEAIIYSWNPCQKGASMAADLGLKVIITEYNSGGGSYYINRKPTKSDYGAGGGDNTLQATYNYVPVPNNVVGTDREKKYYYGVQGTFWCEHVSEPEHMEYLALPRLMALAEAGWTPQAKKNWTSFRDRMRQDTTMLNLGGYNYHPQYLKYDGATPDASASADFVAPQSSTGEEANRYWYKIVSRGVERDHRQIELVQSGSALLSEQKSNGAAVGMLWGNVAAAEGASNYDAQLWALELDPKGSGKYALVNKAQPNGSVNPTASAANTNGRWSYDNNKKNYNFVVGDKAFGVEGQNYYYTIRSDKHGGQWMNCAMPAKGFAINLYSDPEDGSGGLWIFVPTFEVQPTTADLQREAATILSQVKTYASGSQRAPGLFSLESIEALQSLVANPDGTTREQWQNALDEARNSLVFPELNGVFRITNTIERFATRSIRDVKSASSLSHTDNIYANDAWTVSAFDSRDGFTAKVRLKNVETSRFVGSPGSTAVDKIGNIVGTASTLLTLTYQPAEGDFTITGGGKIYYPVSSTAPSNRNAMAASENAIRPTGTGWKFTPVTVLKYICTNQDGKSLANYTYSCPNSELDNPLFPTFDGYTLQNFTIDDDGTTYRLVYSDGSSGITNATVPTAPKGIYDLQGRRLSRITKKGVYIVDGVKTIFR